MQIEVLLREKPATSDAPDSKGQQQQLCSPSVGTFTQALPPGHTVVPGQEIGVLHTLGAEIRLKAPAQASGRITSKLPERVHHPVGYGDVLYELEPIAASDGQSASATEESGEQKGLFFCSPQTGRFWRKPSPKDAALAEEGQELEAGSPVGLIEVMKTFAQVTYNTDDHAGPKLPTRAKLVRFLAEDGAEVNEGDPLAELEAL